MAQFCEEQKVNDTFSQIVIIDERDWKGSALLFGGESKWLYRTYNLKNPW